MAMEWRWEESSQRFRVNRNSQSERSKEAVHTVGDNGCTWKVWVAWSGRLDPARGAESQTNWPNHPPGGPAASIPFVGAFSPYHVSLPETYYVYLAIRFLLCCFVFEGGECLVAAPSGCVCSPSCPRNARVTLNQEAQAWQDSPRSPGKGREEWCPRAPGQGPGIQG